MFAGGLRLGGEPVRAAAAITESPPGGHGFRTDRWLVPRWCGAAAFFCGTGIPFDSAARSRTLVKALSVGRSMHLGRNSDT